MDSIISNLLTSQPTGMWEKIIMWIEGGVGSFAVAIIILTLFIKLIMSPIDFFNRRTSRNMAKMQSKIQPQIEAINKKYANDQKTKNQKLGELYSRNKVNPMGSCVVMLLNLGLTLAIFITLLNGMNAMASYKIATQYEQIQASYVHEYAIDTNQQDKDVVELIKEINAIENETQKAEIIDVANKNATKTYNETNEKFLWIKNIWIADNPFKNSIPSFSEYASVARLSNEQKQDEELAQIYNQIMDPIRDNQGSANGYFILVVICAGVTFLNQWIITKKNKQMQGQNGKSNWVMIIFMTAFMSFFTLLYTTMFALYMITSQIISLGLTPLIELINKKVDEHQEKKSIPSDRLKRI